MGEIKITTDGKWKQFKDSYDVPKAVLADQFDWMDNPDEHSFFKYRNTWYATSDFMHAPGQEFAGWDGYHGDSYFSGVLIQLSPDGEEYRVGTYIQ